MFEVYQNRHQKMREILYSLKLCEIIARINVKANDQINTL